MSYLAGPVGSSTSNALNNSNDEGDGKTKKKKCKQFTAIAIAMTILVFILAVAVVVMLFLFNEETESTKVASKSKVAMDRVGGPSGTGSLQRIPFPDITGAYQTLHGVHYLVSLTSGTSTLKLPRIPATKTDSEEPRSVRLTLESPTDLKGSLNVMTQFPIGESSGHTAPVLVDSLSASKQGPITYEYTYHKWHKRWHRTRMQGKFLDGTI